LVGTDGSATASDAAKMALELGDALSADVTIGFVGAKRMGEIVLGGTKDRLKVMQVQSIQLEGDPAEKICEVAEKEGFDLILVGNKGMSGAKRFLLGSVPNTISHYAPCDVLIARTATKSLTDIGAGEGGIVVVGGDRVALYKDEAGRVFSLSAKCTHLGCTVNWNSADKTWDCPCHGSRYNYDGEVVQGPAQRALPKHSL
ncbi:MAG: universal stress protein, partial [Acidimicrobiia bacterium]